MEPLEIYIYGLAKGLWDIAGESARAIARDIGRELYEAFMKDKIDRSSMDNALKSARKILIEELKTCKDLQFSIKDDLVEIRVKECILQKVSDRLKAEGVPLFFCPYANIVDAFLDDMGLGYSIDSIERTPEGDTLIKLKRIIR